MEGRRKTGSGFLLYGSNRGPRPIEDYPDRSPLRVLQPKRPWRQMFCFHGSLSAGPGEARARELWKLKDLGIPAWTAQVGRETVFLRCAVPAATWTISLRVKGAWFSLPLAKQAFGAANTKTKSITNSTKKKKSASKALAEDVCEWEMSNDWRQCISILLLAIPRLWLLPRGLH